MTGDGSGRDRRGGRTGDRRARRRGGPRHAHRRNSRRGRAVIDTALDAWGRVDILVNNAGTVDPAPFEDITDDRLRGLIDVHLKGAFFVTRPAWKVMRSRGYGRVVNTCSAAGIFGAQRMANYGAAKTGLIGFTRVLAAESAGTDITVNAIAPIAATRMLDHSLSDVTDPVQRTAVDEVMAPFLDALDPALVAPVVAFLAHRDCPVNGEIFTVGGDTWRSSSSAGPGATATRICRSRTSAPISTRSKTGPTTRCRRDRRMRWRSCTKRSRLQDDDATGRVPSVRFELTLYGF